MRITSRILTLFLLAAILLAFPYGARGDYAISHPEFPRLTSRALGMGGATVAWIDDGTSIFHNPAGLGRINSLAISHSHSRNHFPGVTENLDQLDCDPTSFIIPVSGALLGFPLGSAGTGWMLQGELGYDYRTRNHVSIPRERLFGLGPGDRSNGAGFHPWPGGYFGFAHRVSEYNFTSGSELPNDVTWRRSGEGFSSGIQQTVFPGIQYGILYEQMDYDYLPFRDDISAERTKTRRSGWSIRPTAWLLIASDFEKINLKEWHLDPDGEDESIEPTTSPRVTEFIRSHWGVEIKFGPWFDFRWGSFDGNPTTGWSYHIGVLRSDSAWVDGLMYDMVSDFPDPSEYPDFILPDGTHDITDYHPTAFNLGM